MNSIILNAPAKINLTLDVTGKREDGYHYIESIFQTVSIFDTVKLEKSEKGITIICDEPSVPCDQSNIAYKAADLFYKHTNIKGGVIITLEKHIPSQAGLGGGSSDGASVIMGLNKLYETQLDSNTLSSLGGEISADTAFFTLGGTAYVTGIGEILEPIKAISKTHMVIAKGASGVSTPEAYKHIDSLKNSVHPQTSLLKQAIENEKFIDNCNLCSNLFEQIIKLDDIASIKKDMCENGAVTSVMSGSGSSVFGIFKNECSAKACADKLKQKYKFAEYCFSI